MLKNNIIHFLHICINFVLHLQYNGGIFKLVNREENERMKLKLWVEIVLLILGSICFLNAFHDSLIVSALACVGFIIVNIPLARFGRLNYLERRK